MKGPLGHFNPEGPLCFAPVQKLSEEYSYDEAPLCHVFFAMAGLTAKWDPTLESLLDLAEAQGLRPASSCQAGICHTCSFKLIEGEVEYVTEPLNKPDPGCVLICCSKPKTNVVIEV